MKITKSVVTKIYISKSKALDFISIYFENFLPKKGKVTITSFNKSWTSFWSNCRQTGIENFFCSCDKYYLLKNLMPYNQIKEPDINKTINILK